MRPDEEEHQPRSHPGAVRSVPARTRHGRRKCEPPRARSGRSTRRCSLGRTAGRWTPEPTGRNQGSTEAAGIDDRRLYDGSRHTAGTIPNELGVDMPTIMEILRHTQISQRRRYVKGRSHLPKDAMRRMQDAFMPQPEPAIETTIETRDSRAARARRRRRVRQKSKSPRSRRVRILGLPQSRLRDSNPRPTHYECVALAI